MPGRKTLSHVECHKDSQQWCKLMKWYCGGSLLCCDDWQIVLDEYICSRINQSIATDCRTFCTQLTKAYMIKTCCNQLLIASATYIHAHQELFPNSCSHPVDTILISIWHMRLFLRHSHSATTKTLLWHTPSFDLTCRPPDLTPMSWSSCTTWSTALTVQPELKSVLHQATSLSALLPTTSWMKTTLVIYAQSNPCS